jgi:hypothetical protein
MTAPAGSLDAVKSIRDREARIRAATEYIERAEAKAAEARHIRDTDVRALIEAHGPSEAARRSGLSLSTVRLIKGRP